MRRQSHRTCAVVLERTWPRLLRTAMLVVLMYSLNAWAERQPTHTYSAADGLPSNQVTCDVLDSHGYMWFCTQEGLSQFDGYTFTNYGVEQGLPEHAVTAFLETKHGEYFVGTSRGVARFNPKWGPNAPMFTPYGLNETGKVDAITEDVHGTVWIAAERGLFQLTQANGLWSFHRADFQLSSGTSAEGLLSDHAGYLWITIYGASPAVSELWRVSPDGHRDVFSDPFFGNGNRILGLTEDRLERIWLTTYHGLAFLVARPRPDSGIVEHSYNNFREPLLFQASDGRLWLGCKGTWEIVTDDQRQIHFRLVDAHGDGFTAEDRDGNLWYEGRKTQRNGFITYGPEDGLKTKDVRSIFQGVDGSLYFVTGVHSRYIHRFDGDRFTAISPYVPGHDADWNWGGWGWGQTHFQDHLGDWWIATGFGLLRYSKVKRLEDLAHTSPKAFYPGHKDVFRLYEDSRGDVWIISWRGSARWERSSGRFFPLSVPTPISFREDRDGNVWVGQWGGGLKRFRHGRQEEIIPNGGPPTGSIHSLLLDHAGRMWAGTTRSGLVRFDEATADHPTFRVYSTKDGLSSNEVRAITEDHFGKIYFWTGRGVDRLNPETGAIRHYTEADGLIPAGADNNTAFCDRQGRLWFGFGYGGVSRLDPEPDRPSERPPIRITAVRIRGVRYPVSELGEAELSNLTLQPNENQVQIEFASLNFASGEVIKYQYKLEGADNDWSSPTEVRVVNYPRLPSGKYRFLVRAVNSDGVMSPVAAAVGFRLLAPVWMRWWFFTASGALLAALIYWTHRWRLGQLLEVERVRTRIASDLHDDIGSSLTEIAIMSEVARRQSGQAIQPLERIADLSREMVDSMSDIVWAINPKRDQFMDLIQRMRRFGNDVLGAATIRFDLRTHPERPDASLPADLRRELFLIFKEAVNNAARHSRCQHVNVRVEIQASTLIMRIEDDGGGLQTKQMEKDNGHGHGMTSMRERADRLGGDIEFTSIEGTGTTIILTVPMDGSTRYAPHLTWRR